MQTVILAGGLGTRLWPLTQLIPKPMVPVAGAPYLEHQLRALAKQALTDVVILTGHLGEQIEEYFGDGERLGLRIRYHREQIPAGTGGALRDARGLLSQRFLLIYGDSYLPIDYRAVCRGLVADTVRGIVAAYDNSLGDTTVQNNLAIDDEDRVVGYEKASGDPVRYRYVEAGVLALERSVLDLLPPSGPVSLEQSVFPQLIARGELRAVRTAQRFFDIGTPERLKAIEAILQHDHHTHAV